MSLPVGLMNIFVLKSRVEACFAGGLEGFRQQLQYFSEDDFLFKLGAMSERFQEMLDALIEGGLDPDRDLAMAEGLHGPTQHSPGIVFYKAVPEALMGGWLVRAEAEPVSPDIVARA